MSLNPNNRPDAWTEEHTQHVIRACQTAAAWWARKFDHPGPASFDNGDNSRVGEHTQMLATLVALQSPRPTAEQLQLLQDCLAGELYSVATGCQALNRPARSYGRLGCDYHPDRLLADALRLAGISDNLAPWKTNMEVSFVEHEVGVQVSAGYGAPWVSVEPAKDEMPAAGQEGGRPQ